MQYKIPQNVQIEDKIVGPLTLKQLIICGIGGGLTYFVYLSLAKVYYFEVWLPPTAFLGLVTLGFAFLKIHDIPLLQYILLVIEFSFNQQYRLWMPLGSSVKALTMTATNTVKKSKKERVAEKTVMSLSELSRVLDRNHYEHLGQKATSELDTVSDKYLLHKTFLGKNEAEVEEHFDRLNQIAAERKTEEKKTQNSILKKQPPQSENKAKIKNVVHKHELEKGNIEVKF